VTFPEYVGAIRRHFFGIFNCFRLSNMAGKTGNLFFIVFLRKTSAVHLLLGYKIHFTDQIHVFGVGELNNAIKKLLRPYFETGNDKFKMAAAKTGCTCTSASIQDSKEIPEYNPMFWGSRNPMVLSKKIDVETRSEQFKMAMPNRNKRHLVA
jgi:hypothetical protein